MRRKVKLSRILILILIPILIVSGSVYVIYMLFTQEESVIEEKNYIECRVDVRENMGSEIFMYVSCADKKFTARLGTDTASGTGSIIRIKFDLNKIHIFDKRTEKSILAAG